MLLKSTYYVFDVEHCVPGPVPYALAVLAAHDPAVHLVQAEVLDAFERSARDREAQ